MSSEIEKLTAEIEELKCELFAAQQQVDALRFDARELRHVLVEMFRKAIEAAEGKL